MRKSIFSFVTRSILFCATIVILFGCGKDDNGTPSDTIRVTTSDFVDCSEIDEFRPDTQPLDGFWSVSYNRMKRSFLITLPKTIPSDYLTKVVNDYEISRLPDMVSDQDARWAVVGSFNVYCDGARVLEKVRVAPLNSYGLYKLIYVDRDVTLNGSFNVSDDVQIDWLWVELKKGWNRVERQIDYYSGSRQEIYSNVLPDDEISWILESYL